MKKLFFALPLLLFAFFSNGQYSNSINKSPTYNNQSTPYVGVVAKGPDSLYHLYKRPLSAFTGGGSGSPGGSDTYIQFNDGGAFNGISSYSFNKTLKSVRITSNNALDIGDSTVNQPSQIIFRRYPNATINGSRGSIGFIGSTEMNIGLNLDYRSLSHKSFDSTAATIWMFLGANGLGVQGVTKGHLNNDIYNQYGKNMWRVEWLQAANEFVGSRTHTNEVYVWDRTTTDREQSSGRSAKFTVASAGLYVRGIQDILADDTTSLTLGSTSFGTKGRFNINTVGTGFSMLVQNIENNNNPINIRYLKTKASSYALNNGSYIVKIDYNSIASEGFVVSSLPADNFSQGSWVKDSRTSSGGTTRRIYTLDPDGNQTVLGANLSSQYKLSALNTAPSSATDTGTTGEIRVTATYIYVCTATNTWVRSALATW